MGATVKSRINRAGYRHLMRAQASAENVRRRPMRIYKKVPEVAKIYHPKCKRWVRIDALNAHRRGCIRINTDA